MQTNTLVVLAVVSILVFLFLTPSQPYPRGLDEVRPDTVVVDDEKNVEPNDQESQFNGKDHALFVIRDKREIDKDPGYSYTMTDDPFWDEYCESVFADVEILESSDPIAKDFLQSINTKPPIVFLRNIKTEHVVWSMELPRGGTEPIKKKLSNGR